MSRGLVDTFASNSLRTYFRNLMSGLRAPRDSGEHRYAIFQIQRVIVPGSVTVLFLASLIAMAVVFGKEGLRAQDVTIPVTVMQVEKVDLDKLDIEVKPDDKPIVPADIPTDVPAAAPAAGAASGFTGSGELAEPGAVLAPVMTKSPLILRGLYANRGGGGAAGVRTRADALRDHGGTQAGEDAVLRALRWLKTNQDNNGAWAKADAGSGNPSPPAMAGLALLAFLAHGETPSSPEFGLTVEKVIKYLLASQKENGMFVDKAARENWIPYVNGIITYAISEAYAMTKIVALKDAMEKGLQQIIDGQQVGGGYDYVYKKEERFDLSVSGWQFQAMKAAKMAGAANLELDAAIAKGINFLEKSAFVNAGEKSGFVYQGKSGIPASGPIQSMTGVGTLCLQLLGRGNSPCVSAGIQYLERVQPQWPSVPDDKPDKALKAPVKTLGKAPPVVKAPAAKVEKVPVKASPVKAEKAPVYDWYYVTQAKFQKGGKVWDVWNGVFSRELVANQKSDGHWENGDHGGDVYTTCLCTLMLEVYYRYLPSYIKLDEKTDAPKKDADEIAIQISV